MNIRAICDKYLASKGLRRIQGIDEDVTTLLPNIMVNMTWILYEDYIEPIECESTLEKYKSRYKEAYETFRKRFFCYFTDKEKDFITSMMSDFEDYIAEDLKIAFWQVTNVCKEEPLEKQKALAASVMVRVLCQSANIVYGMVFTPLRVRNTGKYYSNVLLTNMIKAMDDWQILYRGKGKPTINLNENEIVNLAINNLCRKQIEYLKIYHNGSRNEADLENT